MPYILKLAGWYPSKVDALNGDFVQRHAKSIAQYNTVVVIYVVKSNAVTTPIIEKNELPNLTEYIGYYPKKRYFDVIQSQLYFFVIFLKIWRQIITSKGLPTLVHVNIVWRAGLWALYLKWRYKLLFVITENSTAYYPEDEGYIKKKYFQFQLTKLIHKQASMLLPVTANLGKVCTHLFHLNKKIIVIPNAVNTQLFYPTPKPTSPIKIIHIGTMGYQKNIKGLLHVIHQLLSNGTTFELVLIGQAGNDVLQLINASKQLKASTVLTGNIPYGEVAKHIQSSHILVLYSRYENLPCVILEALCVGLPVISTAVGGIAEVINSNNGLLIHSENDTSLYNAITQLLYTYNSYSSVSIATQASNLYSYNAIGKLYNNAYKMIEYPS